MAKKLPWSIMLLTLAIMGAVSFVTARAGTVALKVADGRLPIPSERAQAAARAEFREYFARHYGQLNPVTGKAFGLYLVRTYANASGHPVRRYVALDLACKLLASYALHGKLRSATGPLIKYYAVDPYKLRLSLMAPLFHNMIYITEDPVGIRAWGKYAAIWAAEAMKVGDYQPVPGLLRWAVRYDQRVHNVAGVATARKLIKRFRLLRPILPVYLADKKLLKATPNNGPALLRMALYHWLVSSKPNAKAIGNAEAKNAGYASLAEIMKLAAGDSGSAQRLIRLGNLWWNLPKNHRLLAYTPLVQQHAIKIYRRAIPGVASAFSALIGRGDYHSAMLFIDRAKKAAKRTRDPKMLSIARRWNPMLRQARMLHRRYMAALKTLAKKADDPAANQTIGEYLCFLGGQWISGLAYLKLAGLPGLASAAKTDLANPQAPAAQIALGNKWWVLARGYRGIMRTNIELRAGYWYALALKKLPLGTYKDLRYRVAKLQASNP